VTIKAYGEADNDWFIGGWGADAFDGGSGSDWVDYSSAPKRVKVDLAFKAAEDGRGSHDHLNDIENLKGTEHKDEIWGTDGPNEIWALGGDDTVWARGGDDALYGGSGNDCLRGGDGDDDLFGGDEEDHLYGDSGDDLLAGGLGDDIIEGGSGNDLLYFTEEISEGVTVVITPGGNGTSTDGLGGIDELRSSIDGAIGTRFGDLMVGDDSNNEFHGLGGNDILIGNCGDDLLAGGAGEDLIEGCRGDDVLLGGDDNDVLLGGKGCDIICGGDGDNTIDPGCGDNLVTCDDGCPCPPAVSVEDCETRDFGEGPLRTARSGRLGDLLGSTLWRLLSSSWLDWS
jgi:Ca2+-binding RTX toxin-like protein